MGLVASVLVCLAGCQDTIVDTWPAPPPSRVVAIASGPAADVSAANLQKATIAIRIADRAALENFLKLFVDSPIGQKLASEVDDVPAGKVLIAGVVHSGCVSPSGAELNKFNSTFSLQPTGLPAGTVPECNSPTLTVAIVEAASADVPVGAKFAQ